MQLEASDWLVVNSSKNNVLKNTAEDEVLAGFILNIMIIIIIIITKSKSSISLINVSRNFVGVLKYFFFSFWS